MPLSDFRGWQRFSLIFGSFTFRPFVQGTAILQELYRDYHEKVNFLMLYIREALLS